MLVSEKSSSAGAGSGTAGAPSTRQKLARVLAWRKIPLTLQFLSIVFYVAILFCPMHTDSDSDVPGILNGNSEPFFS